MQKIERLLAFAKWSVIGSIFARGVAVLGSAALVRLLGADEFGYLGIVLTTVSTFGSVAGLGLGITSTKYIAEWRDRDLSRVSKIVSLISVVSVVSAFTVSLMMFFSAAHISLLMLGNYQLTNYLRFGAFLLFFNSLNSAQVGQLSGFGKFKQVAALDVLYAVLGLIFALAFGFFGGGHGAQIGYIVASALSCLFQFFALRSVKRAYAIKFDFRTSLSELRILFLFSAPAALGTLVIAPIPWLCNYYMLRQEAGLALISGFTIINQFRNLVMMVPASLANASLAFLAGASAQASRQAWVLVALVNGVTAAFVAVVLMALSGVILNIYGSEIAKLGFEFNLFMLAGAISALNAAVGHRIATAGKMWHGFCLNLLWAIQTVGLVSLLIPKYGLLGCGYSFLISYMCHTVFQIVFLVKSGAISDAI